MWNRCLRWFISNVFFFRQLLLIGGADPVEDIQKFKLDGWGILLQKSDFSSCVKLKTHFWGIFGKNFFTSSNLIFYFILLYHALLYSSPLDSNPHHATPCTSPPHPTMTGHTMSCYNLLFKFFLLRMYKASSKHLLFNFCLFKRGHILIGTPGRLEDLFTRKHEGFDLAAHVRCLVRTVCWTFTNYALTYSLVLKLSINKALEAKKSFLSYSVPRSSSC